MHYELKRLTSGREGIKREGGPGGLGPSGVKAPAGGSPEGHSQERPAPDEFAGRRQQPCPG